MHAGISTYFEDVEAPNSGGVAVHTIKNARLRRQSMRILRFEGRKH